MENQEIHQVFVRPNIFSDSLFNMRTLLSAILISTLTFGMNIYPVNAAIKPGSACSKEGSVSVASGKKYTCIKKGKKLIWNNGVASKASNNEISIDKNLLSVDVTIPASFYEGTNITQEQLNADAAKKGYGKAKINTDGSVSFRMSKVEHKKALIEMKKSLDDYIQEAIDASPGVFREITYDKNMSEFKFLVDRVKFEEDISVGFIGFGVSYLAYFYQMFNGGPAPYKNVMRFIDIATGKVFETQNFPQKD